MTPVGYARGASALIEEVLVQTLYQDRWPMRVAYANPDIAPGRQPSC